MNNILFFEGWAFYYYISHQESQNLMSLCLIPRSVHRDKIPSQADAQKRLLYNLFVYLEEVFAENADAFDFKPLFKEEKETVLELQIRPLRLSKSQTSATVRARLLDLYQKQRA
ncbi:MAG: hypothetical protein OHK0053_28780 [Microscillaceae bacterium]